MIPNKAALLDIIRELSNEEKGTLFVVEGKRDVEAFMRLGILKTNIIKAAHSRYCDLESALRAAKKIIPLFDNDKTGQKRLHGFDAYFTGVTPIDHSYGTKIKSAGVYCIEDLDDILLV